MVPGDTPPHHLWYETMGKQMNATVWLADALHKHIPADVPIIPTIGNHGKLTHLPLDKMDAISQTIFQMHFREWNAGFVIWLKFHWSLILRAQLTITKD